MRKPLSIRIASGSLGVLIALAAGCSRRAPEPPAAPSPAQPVAPSSSPLDIPMMAPRMVATLEKTHARLVFAWDTEPGLGYDMAAPKDWSFSKPSSTAAGPDGVMALGSITGPSAWGPPTIVVSATTPKFEIPIDAWLRGAFAQNGYKIVAAHWFPGRHGLYFEATGTRLHDGVEEVRRSSVRADGGHVFSVTCVVPRVRWDDVKEIFWVALDSFALLKGTGESRLETWLTARGKRPDFQMAYPGSWVITQEVSPPSGTSAVDLRLSEDGQTSLAYLQVRAQRLSAGPSIAPLERLRDASLERAKGIGFATEGAPAPLTEDNDPRAVAVAGWLGGFVAQGRMGSSDATVRMGFVRNAGRLTTFLAFAPAAQDDPMVALRAQRAFEIARATVEAD